MAANKCQAITSTSDDTHLIHIPGLSELKSIHRRKSFYHAVYILVIVFCISTVKLAMFHKTLSPSVSVNMAAFIRQQVQSYFLERKYLFRKEIFVSIHLSLSLFAAVQMAINQDWFR